MPRQLKPEAQEDRDAFESEDSGCSCHINPPCGHCTHPGNPLNQEDDEFYEEVPDEPEPAHPAPENCAMCYQPQRREQLGWKLFPQRHLDLPEMKGAKDVLVCYVDAELSFLDRIRILISGRARVSVKAATENVIGNCTSASMFCVKPPTWLDRR